MLTGFPHPLEYSRSNNISKTQDTKTFLLWALLSSSMTSSFLPIRRKFGER